MFCLPEVWSAPLASPAGKSGPGPGGRPEKEDRMQHAHGQRHLRWGTRAIAVAGSAALVSALSVAGAASAGLASPALSASAGDQARGSCHLGNGIKHVIQIGFDNVHFFRDNPNVPSDLQMMPNLLDFFTSNGTFLSNNHTPLIAHTAVDLLTTFTGLYGDRQGMPI